MFDLPLWNAEQGQPVSTLRSSQLFLSLLEISAFSDSQGARHRLSKHTKYVILSSQTKIFQLSEKCEDQKRFSDFCRTFSQEFHLLSLLLKHILSITHCLSSHNAAYRKLKIAKEKKSACFVQRLSTTEIDQ